MHGSDKFGSHYYTPFYHEYFSSFRGEEVNIFEIGIGGYSDPDGGGASLRMWRDYFPNARIFGLDYFRKNGLGDERVRVFQGKQTDPIALAEVINAAPNRTFKAVIDDGSHRAEDIVGSFLALFPYVEPDGWYVVEDTETSYFPQYGGAPGGHIGRLTAMSFFKSIVDNLNWRARDVGYSPGYFDDNISGIYFHYNMIFIRKGQSI